MFNRLKEVIEKILHLSASLDKYEKESIVQAMPSLAFVNRAKKCIEENNLQEAEKILEEAKSLPQEDALVYKYLGTIYERTGRIEEAIASYKKSANLNNQDKEIWRLLGFTLVNTGKSEEAEEAFENANKISPMNTDTFAGWGMALMKQKRYAEAHEKFIESVRINKYNFMALLLAAIMEVRTGQYNEAETKLSFLANVSPNETNNYEYANLKYIKEDWDNAIHYAKKALEFNKNMLPAYLLLGKLYVIKGQKENSLSMYEEAYQRELLTQHLFFDWGVTLQIYGEYSLAREKFQKAEEYTGEDSEIKAGVALALAGDDEITEAEEIINKIEDLDDTNYIYTKAKALILLKKGCYKEAIDKFKQLKEQIFFDLSLNFYIACAYEQLGDTNNAKEYFEKALVENPSELKVYLKYSEFLINNQDYENAQRKLRRSLKLKEDDLEILNLLFHVSYILVKQNNCEYNVRETLSIGEKIKSIDENGFKYTDEYSELKEYV